MLHCSSFAKHLTVTWRIYYLFLYFFIDIDDETFAKLQPHHIKEILPNMSERVAFEYQFSKFLQTETTENTPMMSTFDQEKDQHIPCQTENIANYGLDTVKIVSADADLHNFLIGNEISNSIDQGTSRQLPHIVVYQNLNVRSPADILAITSIDLKIVVKKYSNNIHSLETNDRVIIARAIIHHLLVTNLNRM